MPPSIWTVLSHICDFISLRARTRSPASLIPALIAGPGLLVEWMNQRFSLPQIRQVFLAPLYGWLNLFWEVKGLARGQIASKWQGQILGLLPSPPVYYAPACFSVDSELYWRGEQVNKKGMTQLRQVKCQHVWLPLIAVGEPGMLELGAENLSLRSLGSLCSVCFLLMPFVYVL